MNAGTGDLLARISSDNDPIEVDLVAEDGCVRIAARALVLAGGDFTELDARLAAHAEAVVEMLLAAAAARQYTFVAA